MTDQSEISLDNREAPALPDPQPNDFPGVTTIMPPDVPPDLVKRVQSDRYSITGFYQVDNLARFRQWKGIMQQSGTGEKWLFYGCPLTMLEQVIRAGAPLRYGEFFPALLGSAVYLYPSAQDAARLAFKFGVERRGCLISCRLALGMVSTVQGSSPQADQPTSGYDTVLAPKGTNLGDGPLPADLYAVFDPTRVLMRYITRIELNR